jgi:hypothetical protein
MARVLELIWGKWEQKYFSENPKKRLDSRRNTLTGKSLGCGPDGANRCAKRRLMTGSAQSGMAAVRETAPDFAALHPSYSYY